MNCDKNQGYTQNEIAEYLGISQQGVSKRLHDVEQFTSHIISNRKVKHYSLNTLPEDWRPQLVASEMAAEPETALEVAAKMLPESQVPLKAWQREIRDARLLVLDCVNRMAPAMGGVTKSTKEFAERSQNGFHNAEIATLVEAATAKKMGKGVSVRTLHTWRKDLETKGPNALAPQGGTPPAWPPWLDNFLKVYRVPGRPSIKLIYECLTAQGEQLPDLRTVQNWVSRCRVYA